MTKLKWILAILLSIVSVALLWFLGHVAWIVYDGLTDETYKAHVAFVQGQPLLEGKLSPESIARLNNAFDLFNERRVQRILVSGGSDGDSFEEATKMGQYLVKRGVPQELIFVDQLGDNLFQTASQAQRILAPYEGLRSIAIMGSWYDILRSKQAFHHCGFLAVYGYHSHHFEWSDLWTHLPGEVFRFYPGILRKCPPPIAY